MQLPTPAQVQALLTVTFPVEVVEGAIEDAVLILGDCANGYDDARNKSIIKYLAAHLLASSPQGAAGSIKSESVDGTSYSLATAVLGDGLKGTSFGQQAMLMDINGCLADRDKSTVKMVLL